jgi:23S rRNA (adenine2503-C2)-methyltransferase
MSDLSTPERERILAKAALFAPPPATTEDGRRDLVGLSREELAAEMVAIGEKPFRASQLWHWIYHQGVTDFAKMPTIAKPMQAKLAERFVVGRPEVATEQTSADTTRKFLFRFRDGQQVETVYIPSLVEDRGAVCISTQVAARSPAASATRARRSWCATSARRRSSASSWRRETATANGRARRTARRGCSPTSSSWAWGSRSTITRTRPRRCAS